MANTTIIIIGYNAAMNRTETRVDRSDPSHPVPICFPPEVAVVQQCPTCKSGIVYAFNAATNQMLSYAGSGASSKLASEYYQLETETAAIAKTWVTSTAEAPWLNDPSKVIFVLDGGVDRSKDKQPTTPPKKTKASGK